MAELNSPTSVKKNEEIVQEFINPSSTYGPIPFWWWHGEPLEMNRLKWQLQQLQDKGVKGTVINYQHDNNMETEIGDPEIFSSSWWGLWDEIVEECDKLGMTIGFSDYTLTWPDKGPVAKALLNKYPELRGTKIDYVAETVKNGNKTDLRIPSDAVWMDIKAYRLDEEGKLSPNTAVELLEKGKTNCISWEPQHGTWKVIGVYKKKEGFDPTHPNFGKKTIEQYYQRFIDRHPDKRKNVLNYFFQDEVNFIMSGMPYWSELLKKEFIHCKGYNIQSNLIGLWFDIGPATPKIRLDYFDVVVTLMEEGYFRPIYEWFKRNGMRMGCDQEARGFLKEGVQVYGDYFRILRWFDAPGSDDPGAGKSRDLIRAKIHSSIAELYERPRVWLEGYHSSGWGVTPSQLISFTNENFVYGYNLLNLHGCYYTTYAGWWEWAPPDFHFRQPYWKHMIKFNHYVTRLSCLLSQGIRVSDIAILYPTSSIQAGYHPKETEAFMYEIGNYLFESKLDFDFIDDDSIQEAEIIDGQLCISEKRYKVVILPKMSAIRIKTWDKIMHFFDKGGFVLAYGGTPIANDALGKADHKFLREIDNVFQSDTNGKLVKNDVTVAKEWIQKKVGYDFYCETEGIFFHHRKIGNDDMYMIFNNDKAKSFSATFKNIGHVEHWDAWSGDIYSMCKNYQDEYYTTVDMYLEEKEAKLLFFNQSNSTKIEKPNKENTTEDFTIPLSNEWDIHYNPVLDNTWGDFEFPKSNETVGPQVRRFSYTETIKELNNWKDYSFDDSNWERYTYSFGPKFLKLGPFHSNESLDLLEEQLLQKTNIEDIKSVDSNREFSTYSFSDTMGIENDPQHQYWLAGPHGLKQNVPDEFIDLGNELGNDEGFYHSANVEVLEKTEGTFTPPGSVWYLWSNVYSDRVQEKYLHLNAVTYTSVYPIQEEKLPCTVWINGLIAADHAGSHLVTLQKGQNQILIKLVQSQLDTSLFKGKSFPGRLRLRSYAAFTDKHSVDNNGLWLNWPKQPGYVPFNIHGKQSSVPGYFRFQLPPGLRSMLIRCAGGIEEFWIDGKAARVEKVESSTNFQTYKIQPYTPKINVSVAAMKLKQTAGLYGGAAIPEPIKLELTSGKGQLGDWSNLALQSYSGLVVYSKEIEIEKQLVEKKCYLNLGEVSTTAKIFVNSHEIDTLVMKPWTVEISNYLQPGVNKIEIEVANTLANHYSIGIPSMYVYPGQTKSGLFGPVSMYFY